MCIICVASSSFDFTCSQISEDSSSILPEDVEASENSYGKTSFDSAAAASQITRGNYKWDDDVWGNFLGEAATVTYGYSATYDDGNTALNQAMMAVVEESILAIEEVANIEFSRIGSGTSGSGAFTDEAEIDIEAIPGYSGGYASWGYTYSGSGNPYEITNATVALGATAGYNEDQDYGTSVTLHEIAHAIGLSHPGDYNGADATTYEQQAEYFEDSMQYSVMSYWSETKTGADFFAYAFTGTSYEYVGGSPTNLMLHDIVALHRLYGANMETRTEDTVYGFNSNTNDTAWTLDSAADSIIASVWDAAGIDTLDLSGFFENADVDLRQEAFSSFGGLKWNFSIADGVDFENASGGYGDDVILGNDLDNLLIGNAGADQLTGGFGSDQLFGGDGNDTLNGGDGVDTVNGGDGIDTLDLFGATNTQKINLVTNVNIGGFAHNDTFLNIENVIGSDTRGDDVTGTAGTNELFGMGADDILRGFNGDDNLFGGENNDFLYGGRGADELDGGNGNDWAMYNDSDHGVTVDLNGVGSGGIFSDGDTYTDIERVRGSNHDDDITMNDESNKVLGGDGEDIINGMGGKDQLRGGNDNDTLNGGTGNDTMFGDAGSDIFQFDNGSGADWVADFENDIDSIELDAALAGGALFGMTAQQVVDTYGTQVNVNRIDLNFGNGDILKIIDTGITFADLYDDVSVV